MKKSAMCLALAAVIIIGGCSPRDPDIIDVEKIEKIDLSYKMATELPCVKAEDIYRVDSFDVNWESDTDIVTYPCAYDGEYLYFTISTSLYKFEYDQIPAKVIAFNPKTGEEKNIFEKLPTEDEWRLNIYPAAVHNSHFFFFTDQYVDFSNSDELKYDFYDINLIDGTTFTTTVEKMPAIVKTMAETDNCIYWADGNEDEDETKETFYVTCYNLDTKAFSVFRDNARVPSSYKNGVLYYHNGTTNVFYCGKEADADTGVYYEGDEMLYDSDSYIARQFSDYDNIMYRYWCGEWIADLETYKCRGIGIYDRNFKRIDLAESVYDYKKTEFNSNFVFASDTGLMSFSITKDNKPIIYDIKNNLFAAVDFEDNSTKERIYGFSADNSIVFYRGGYFDDDFNYFEPQFYEVKRKEAED